MTELNIPVVPFYTEVAGRAPLPSLIEPGELALNLTDRIIYSKKTDGTIVTMGAGAGGGGGGASALEDLTDVSITSAPAQGQALVWDGLAWVLGPVLGGVNTAATGAISARYWRIASISVPGGGWLDLTELHLRQGSTVHAATVTSSTASSGSLADLVDGSLGARNYWGEATAEDSGFWIQYDLGTAKTVDGLGQAPAYANRGISSFVLQYSNNGTTWTSLAPISVPSAPEGTLTVTSVPTSGVVSTYLPFNINRLDDVDTSTLAPANGDALLWDGTKWKPGNAASSGVSLSGLSDVSVPDPGSGQALVWDGTKWGLGPVLAGWPSIVESAQSYWSNVSLFLDGSSTSVDQGPTPKTLTQYGTIDVSTAQVRERVSTLFWPPTGSNYLRLGDSTAFDLSGVASTIEAWIYPTSVAGFRIFLYKGTYGANESWYLGFDNSGIQLGTGNGGGNYVRGACTVTPNTWHHVAATHVPGGGIRLWFNGQQVGHRGDLSISNGGADITVGCACWNNPQLFFTGYLQTLRVIKGQALYTSAFTPAPRKFADPALIADFPISSLSNVRAASAEAGAFLCFDGENWVSGPKFEIGSITGQKDIVLPMTGADGSTTFPNLGTSGATVSRSGNVSIGGSAGRFTGGGAVFRGGYLQVAAPALPGDFVISGWTRIDARPSTYEAIFELGQYTNGILFRGYQSWINGQNIGDVNPYFTIGVYTHWLWSRTGSTVRLFIAGALVWQGTVGGTVNSGANAWRIGADVHAGGSQPVTASMGRFELAVGTNGGFTAPFTPPTNPSDGITKAPMVIDALQDVDTTTAAPVVNQALVWDGTSWVPGNPTVAGVGRASSTGTTPSIAIEAAHTLTLTGVGRAGVLIRLRCNGIAWVTVYSDLAALVADAGRSFTTDPAPGSGVIAEALTTNSNWLRVTPAVGYFNLENPTVDALYVRVINKDTGTRAFQVQLEVSRTEP